MENQTNKPIVKDESKIPPTHPTQSPPVNPGMPQVAKSPEQEKTGIGNEKKPEQTGKTL